MTRDRRAGGGAGPRRRRLLPSRSWALNARRDTIDNMKVKTSPGIRRTTLAILVLLVAATGASGLATRNPLFGYSIDLPVGWTAADTSDPYHIGFLSPGSEAMLQVIALDPATGDSGAAIAGEMLLQLRTEAEHAPFEFLGLSAALSDVSFVTAGNEVRGYMISIDAEQADFVLLAFALAGAYEAAHDHLLSALDSFALDEERVLPGPVSEFFHPLSAASAARPGGFAPVPFGSTRLTVPAGPAELDSAEVLVEREARILAPYGSLDRETFESAWRRYFRIIYRDSFARLESLSLDVGAALEQARVPRVDYPAEVLSWLQGFEYERTGGLSDFRPPLSCLVAGAGDCDSLALTYVIIMHHLGFDAILMVSDRYAHALAAVDAPGPGARFPFEGRQWLVAELTDDVAMGQIAADMADPAGWIGVRMRLRQIE